MANRTSFDSQYCLVSIKTPFLDRMKSEPIYQAIENTTMIHTKRMIDFNYGSVLGFCLPSTCQINDLLHPLNELLQEHKMEAISQNHCTLGGYQDTHYLNRNFFICL